MTDEESRRDLERVHKELIDRLTTMTEWGPALERVFIREFTKFRREVAPLYARLVELEAEFGVWNTGQPCLPRAVPKKDATLVLFKVADSSIQNRKTPAESPRSPSARVLLFPSKVSTMVSSSLDIARDDPEPVEGSSARTRWKNDSRESK